MGAADKKFVFVLLSRFPTEKAYGVTTRYSAMALMQLGYPTEIITPFSNVSNVHSIRIIKIGEFIAKFFLSNKIKKFLKLRFNVFLVLFVYLIRTKYKKYDCIFWCRDIYLAYLLSIFSNKQVICEIHRTPKYLQSICLQILIKRENIIIAPISHFLSEKFKLIAERTAIAPMSVNEADLNFFDGIVDPKLNTIVYVGNSQSGGNNLNVNLINEAARIILNNNSDWIIQIIGIDAAFYSQNIKNAIPKNIQIIGLVNRDEVLIYLSKAKIGLVIYPEFDWFKDSFPIKIVEYSAARLAIIASNTTSHRRILDESRCIFFEEDSHTSLASNISQVIADSKLLDRLAHNSNIWVRDLTYQNRIRNVINKLII